MKKSTLEMIDAAMAFNVEVQEDNLHLQERKYNLLQKSKNLIGQTENLLGDALFSMKSYEEYTNPNSIRKQISLELLSMIDSGLADLNKKIDYPHFIDVPQKSAIMYNAGTIWNLCTCFKSMLSSLSDLANKGLLYEAIRKRFIDDNSVDLMVTSTHISDEDYVEINLPQPKFQSVESADMNKDNLNAAGKVLNSFITPELMNALDKTKLEVSAKMALNPVDAIKSAHFISQMTMAIKNAILLMKNYHNATLNELQ